MNGTFSDVEGSAVEGLSENDKDVYCMDYLAVYGLNKLCVDRC